MSVVVLDTSIFCDIVRVPGRSQRSEETLARLHELTESGSNLLLPLAAVYETGNHVARAGHGRERRAAAQRFVRAVKGAIAGEAPWAATPFPEAEGMLVWLDDFPDRATAGVGLADLSIIQVFEKQCALNRARRVWIWSHDAHLAGYDRPAEL